MPRPPVRADPRVAKLAQAESDLARIEAQRIAAKARIAALRSELAAHKPAPRPLAPVPLMGLALPHFATREPMALDTASAGVNTPTPSIVIP